MRNNIATAAVLVIGLAAPQLATADEKMELGLFAGVHGFNDNNELGFADDAPPEGLEDGLVFGVRIGRRLHAMLSAEGELAIIPTKAELSRTDVVALGYRLSALLHPVRFAGAKLEPFALLGLGGMTAASSDVNYVKSETDFVWHAGLGARYRIGAYWGVRIDARLLLPPARDGLVTMDGELMIAIYQTFGPKPAPAPVLIPALAPAPTADPAPPPPAAASKADRDGDGIGDATDRCPDEPEDRDGKEDDDGCPDPDDDGDGVPDAADRCPDQAETKNAFQDDDGCADEVPVAIQKLTGTIAGIAFVATSDRLTPGSSRVLDEAVKVLAANPALRLEISGHTDNVGDAVKNRELSRRRAEAVKAYLVAKGIAADRLEAVGFGPDQPLEMNSTPALRAKNRRVEFRLR
ncbi:MAG: OmpA family protein [Myxococcota bacterium]|nr:OmpA family protein [Myxococcota bacterium]